MKFSLNQGAVMDGAIMMIAASFGVVASDALINVLPAEHRQISKAGIAGGGLLGASGLQKDKSQSGSALKFMALGMGVKQSVNLMRDVFAKNYTPNKEDRSMVDLATEGALGLACPDNMNGLAGESYNAQQVGS